MPHPPVGPIVICSLHSRPYSHQGCYLCGFCHVATAHQHPPIHLAGSHVGDGRMSQKKGQDFFFRQSSHGCHCPGWRQPWVAVRPPVQAMWTPHSSNVASTAHICESGLIEKGTYHSTIIHFYFSNLLTFYI